MKKVAEVRIPWPGPRPYDEHDWEVFSGRDSEIAQIRDKINFQKLTVLVGGSGTGKTSLVRAGVIPLLRLERYDERSDQSQWPVLLLRRWGGEGGQSIGDNLQSQIDDSIQAIEKWGKRYQRALEDAEVLRESVNNARRRSQGTGEIAMLLHAVADDFLRRRRPPMDATYQPAGLKPGAVDSAQNQQPLVGGATTGVIFVFDQFEELLRPGGEAAATALHIVRDLYRSRSPLRLLISMRQEYVYALRELEQTIGGGLSSRSIFLRPLPEKTVLEMIAEVSESADFRIDSEVAITIVKWLRHGSLVHARSEEVGDEPEIESVREAEIGRPDLLRLQAVLRELSLFAIREGATSVTGKLLRKFGRPFGGDPRKIVGGSLERWIEAAIKRTAEFDGGLEPASGDAVSSYAKWAEMSEAELERQVRHIAIRIGPNLSSQDYKVSQEENDLFKSSLGEDIWRLGMNDPRLRDQVRIIDGQQGAPPSLNSVELGLFVGNVEREKNKVSGWAKRKGWSTSETADKLVVCFRETLHRLARANILTQTKQFGKEPKIWWELVHDQFGPSFTSWAREHRDTWLDCESSLTVCNGIQPIMMPGDVVKPAKPGGEYVVRKISWRGCSVEPGRGERLILRGVRFSECYLVGTIFERCRFEGGSFEKCDLNGVLFRDCEFVATDGVAPLFKMCDSSNVAIVASRIEALEVENCELQQPTIMATLDGRVYFRGSRVAQAYFEVKSGKRRQRKRGRVVFGEGSRAFFCSADLESLKLIDYGSQQDVASGAVPDRFFRRRAIRLSKTKP